MGQLQSADHVVSSLRKKKKKSHSTSDRAKVDADISQKGKTTREQSGEVEETRPSGQEGRKLTEAERRFEETQRRRVSGSTVERRRQSVDRAGG